MDELEELEQEFKMIEKNIKRVKQFVKENKEERFPPYMSRVFGELKHRLMAFKQSINVITNMSTEDLFREKK